MAKTLDNSALRSAVIASQNDGFRWTHDPTAGIVVMTPAVEALDHSHRMQLLLMVRSFDQFTLDNDPWGEHDFGVIMQNGREYFWKIDLLDRNNKIYYPNDPTDPKQTFRVLTIMEASEY